MMIGKEKRKVLEELPLALAVFRLCDGRAEPLLLSDGFCSLFGRPSKADALIEMKDNPTLCRPDEGAKTIGPLMRFIKEGEPYEMMYRARRENSGMERLIHARGEKMIAEDGSDLFYIWYMEGPPVEGHPMMPAAAPGANNKIFVELPERSAFFPNAVTKSQGMLRNGTDVAFMFFDLNGMKYYNTRYSFEQGNKLLRSFGLLLGETFGMENCCHLGGDHYTAYSSAEGLDEVLDKFFTECKKLNDGKSLPVHAGIYVDRKTNFPITIAIDRAKYACDSLRDTYESVYIYYTDTLNDDLEYRQYILSHLDQALEEGWIKVYYQPIVRAVSLDISDEEALARWEDPERGLLSPLEFIPILEEARIIYKMDLYVLEQILEKIKMQEEAGFFLVPQSLNVSRTDFDSCDMVEEVRRRVDEAGVPHNLITIELTESMVGRNQEFIKQQIERFHELGFSVWLDDFGSGYSSINVMQSMPFDLIKIDMEFLKRLEEGVSGKTVLSELIRLALALNMDTVCEGVETQEQVDFLREIGCAKLQGYYFSKPHPFHAIMEMAEQGQHIRFENPSESHYYDTMGRINLYDLSVIAMEDDDFVQNYFDMLPMAIVEMRKDSVRFTRSNPSYRDFAKRFFDFDMTKVVAPFPLTPEIESQIGVLQILRECAETGVRTFIDEMMEDGAKVHAFVRKIADNPVTGGSAVLIAVLSVEETDLVSNYENIARVLAPDYFRTYHVNLDNDEYVEYSSSPGNEVIAMEVRGKNFFDAVKRDVPSMIFRDDQEALLQGLTRVTVLKELDSKGVYTLKYRLLEGEKPVPVELKVIRLHQGGNHLILKVRKLDEASG